MLSKKRAPNLLRARLDTALLLRSRGWSYAKIGRFMQRDHTTVMYWFWREET